MSEDEIRTIVRVTIEELKRSGILKPYNETAYAEASEMLRAYFSGDSDERIETALKHLERDPYYKILPLYYDYGYTIEKIAEHFEVEVSTIVRNKKRLCLAIYAEVT